MTLEVPRFADVLLVSLKYGKARKAKYNDRGLALKDQLKLKRTLWEVETYPQDLATPG